MRTIAALQLASVNAAHDGVISSRDPALLVSAAVLPCCVHGLDVT